MAACAAASAGGVAACHHDSLPSYSSIQAGKRKKKKHRDHQHPPQKHGPHGQHRQAQREYKLPQADFTQGGSKLLQYSRHKSADVICTSRGVADDSVLSGTGEALPEEFLGWALFSMCCCMCPIGLVAVKKSCDVRDALARGDIPAARSHSKTTLLLIKISVISGIPVFVALIVCITIYFLVLV